MSFISPGLRRAIALKRMPSAIKRGLSVTKFIDELRGLGLSYRRSVMLADWRSAKNVEAKEGSIKFVRRDRKPSGRFIADVEWNLSKEYMYKIKTWTRLRPGDPLEERFVNIVSDVVLTLEEAEEELYERWEKWEMYKREKVEKVAVESIFHKIPKAKPVE